tara:strand:+ start:12942 stop:13928 length:987 start_codon:yes stop_codon:yes gene_type:complete
MSSATEHRKAFRDVVRGYSSAVFDDGLVYIRHLTPHDQVELEDITDLYIERAKKRGLPTNQDMMDLLEKEGDWTQKDERDVEKLQAFIETLQISKKKLVIKSAIDKQNEIIEQEQEKLNVKLLQKDNLIGNTCEKYAAQRTNDFYILKSFYKNESFDAPLYTEAEYDELDSRKIAELIKIYNDTFHFFSEDSIQYLILEDFYQPYLNFADDSMQFYGKAFCSLTYNQIRMIVYTRIFKNIFENNENIPEKIRKDPKALLDFGSTSSEEREKMKSRFEDSDGSTIVGAKDEDYEYLGIQKPAGGIDLHKEAQKKGGSLSMQDMMKLSGV